MIRYVPIPAKAINPHGGKEGEMFAWYNSITDRFIEFAGGHVFESWEDFEEAYEMSSRTYPLARFKALFPDC